MKSCSCNRYSDLCRSVFLMIVVVLWLVSRVTETLDSERAEQRSVSVCRQFQLILLMCELQLYSHPRFLSFFGHFDVAYWLCANTRPLHPQSVVRKRPSRLSNQHIVLTSISVSVSNTALWRCRLHVLLRWWVAWRIDVVVRSQLSGDLPQFVIVLLIHLSSGGAVGASPWSGNVFKRVVAGWKVSSSYFRAWPHNAPSN